MPSSPDEGDRVESLNDIMTAAPYAIESDEKDALYRRVLSDLTEHHVNSCREYRAILQALDYTPRRATALEQLPYLPVRLFKECQLCSVPQEAVVKTLTSSGTSGQRVSRIYLDRQTAHNQSRVLAKIMSSYLGPRRLPMLVIDSASTVSNRRVFSARAAGILGFARFGRDMTYALRDDMSLDLEAIESFLGRNQGRKILFGFTFMIWRHLLHALQQRGAVLNMGPGILIHGGGWKHLHDLAVDEAMFRDEVRRWTGVGDVHSYYGMVEQVGSIFVECERGYFHCSSFSHVVIRDPRTFEPLPPGERGLVQLLSPLPSSYPGHSILSEDLGEVVGTDDCPCGRRGTYFLLHGRMRNAELRGCSNTYTAP
jgi:phenylacetate-coenzyme A ligase PaaK-like adenylate-forming protein